jgi:hypothetical protein
LITPHNEYSLDSLKEIKEDHIEFVVRSNQIDINLNDGVYICVLDQEGEKSIFKLSLY